MELVNRQRFTDMLRTLVDVTEERLVYIEMDEPIKFTGYSTHYTRKGILLAEVLHTDKGSVYRIDTKWEENHNTDFTCPPHGSNIELGMDNRGWIFTAIRNRNDYPESHCIRVLAGCRNFSLQQAKEHWKDNSEVYPRILMAEMIAAHRGWIKGTYLTPDYKLAYREDYDPEAEPQVDAGELACEKTPTIIMESDFDELVQPTLSELRHQEKLMHEHANPER